MLSLSLSPAMELGDKYSGSETSPMELPLMPRLMLKLRSWLLVHQDGSINRWMQKLMDTRVPAKAVDGGPVSASDEVIDEKTGVWVRLFTPREEQQQKFPIMFYFHGGGFTMFSANSPFSDAFGRHLCKTFRAMVISVDYRKTPEHRHPAAYDDCYAALQWLQRQSPSNADLSKCFLVGESAGANIVHHVACRAASDPALGLNVIGNLLLFPFLGGEERTAAELRLVDAPMLNYIMCDLAWKDFLPPGATRDHPAANVCGRDAPDLSSLPLAPFLVTVGEYDCLKDWQVRYTQALKRMGKSVELRFYKGGIHCFHAFPQLKLTAQFHADLEHFVRSCLL